MYESLLQVPIDDFHLDGTLYQPVRARSIVIFAHGSGGSRYSPRNKMIARALHAAGYGTFLFDFLGEHEADDYEKRFDTVTLSRRLRRVAEWIHSQEAHAGFDLALFGAGLGGAIALNAAAQRADLIKAVVCRGAQTNAVTKASISRIKSPVLLIAGEQDTETVAANRHFLEQLSVPTKLITIPGAGHLMQQPRMMRQVARETTSWYGRYLRKDKQHPELEYDEPDREY